MYGTPNCRTCMYLQERDEWVAELRVASRVVPLEDIFQIKALLRKGAFASVSETVIYSIKVKPSYSMRVKPSFHEREMVIP